MGSHVTIRQSHTKSRISYKKRRRRKEEKGMDRDRKKVGVS